MKKTLFLSLLLVTLVLSACKTGPENTSDQELNADSILDAQLLEEAAGSLDAEKCSKILNESKKIECVNVVEASIISDKALEALDSSLCKDIKLDRYKTNCEFKVGEQLGLEEKQIEKEKNIQKDLETEGEAIEGSDPSICSKIGTESKRSVCQYNAVINKAVEDKNPKLCDIIEDKSLIDKCKASIL